MATQFPPFPPLIFNQELILRGPKIYLGPLAIKTLQGCLLYRNYRRQNSGSSALVPIFGEGRVCSRKWGRKTGLKWMSCNQKGSTKISALLCVHFSASPRLEKCNSKCSLVKISVEWLCKNKTDIWRSIRLTGEMSIWPANIGFGPPSLYWKYCMTVFLHDWNSNRLIFLGVHLVIWLGSNDAEGVSVWVGGDHSGLVNNNLSAAVISFENASFHAWTQVI